MKLNLKDKQIKEAAVRMLLLAMPDKYVSKLRDDGIVTYSDNESAEALYTGNHSLLDENSFLYVSTKEDEWCDDKNDILGLSTMAYVTWSEYAEFGYIGVQPIVGGVLKTW